VAEYRLFDEGTIPECTTAAWYEGREVAPHLDQEGHRERLHWSANLLRNWAGPRTLTVCDLGAGDGGFLTLLPDHWSRWGYDLSPAAVAGAEQRGMDVRLLDVVEDRNRLTLGQVAVVQEFLEHIVDPHGYLRWLHDQTGVEAIVASSPYTETDTSHYEHHVWAWDQRGYRNMLKDAGWNVVDQTTAWICQIQLAVRA
jgi:hypothetical protein